MDRITVIILGYFRVVFRRYVLLIFFLFKLAHFLFFASVESTLENWIFFRFN